MRANEYQTRAMSTRLPSCENATYMLFGLMAEVGEIAAIYGSGFLISHTAAERVAAERAAVKKETIVWELSEREMRIVEKLGQ